MLSIHLNNLRFHAFHGLYPAEKKLGNEFEVNITVKHKAAAHTITSLHETIDYVAVYDLLKQKMSIPTPLLETLVQDFCVDLLEQFPLAQEVFINITKLYPPVSNFQGNVGVSFAMKRDSS